MKRLDRKNERNVAEMNGFSRSDAEDDGIVETVMIDVPEPTPEQVQDLYRTYRRLGGEALAGFEELLVAESRG